MLLNPGADGLDLGQFWHNDLRLGLAKPCGCQVNVPVMPL
jgi:hypothetical protein